MLISRWRRRVVKFVSVSASAQSEAQTGLGIAVTEQMRVSLSGNGLARVQHVIGR